MIDTVVLRLHDLRKNESLIKNMNLKRNPGFSVKSATVDGKEFDRISNMGYSSKRVLDILDINRAGEFLVKTQIQKQMNLSYHYEFTYRIDYTNDFIEFNFSIPKFKFGSNVLMFVEHSLDTHYSFARNSTLEYNIENTLLLFRPFIKKFLEDSFIHNQIDLSDLEVNRIDVCYNQIFKSKEEALNYLNYQKKLKKKHSRDEDGIQTNYNTSIMFKTNRCSYKIYHKGTEYKKHDLKEHKKINKEKGYQYFNIKEFQSFADRILRYEITIRSAELNYLFKHNIFRKKCPIFQLDYKSYMNTSNKIKRNDRIAKKIGELPADKKEFFKKLHPYEKITQEERKVYKYISHLIEQKPKFFMSITEDKKEYNHKTVSYKCDAALFGGKLLKLCLNKLIKFTNEFQIKELPDSANIERRIDEYNSYNKNKLQKSDIVNFFELLKKYGSFKEASKFGGYSRATLYRYKDRFKKIGIADNHIHVGRIAIEHPPIDFKEYHSFLMYNNLLRGIKIR